MIYQERAKAEALTGILSGLRLAFAPALRISRSGPRRGAGSRRRCRPRPRGQRGMASVRLLDAGNGLKVGVVGVSDFRPAVGDVAQGAPEPPTRWRPRAPPSRARGRRGQRGGGARVDAAPRARSIASLGGGRRFRHRRAREESNAAARPSASGARTCSPRPTRGSSSACSTCTCARGRRVSKTSETTASAARLRLDGRITELRRRLAAWEPRPSVDRAAVAVQRERLADLERQRAGASAPPAPAAGATSARAPSRCRPTWRSSRPCSSASPRTSATINEHNRVEYASLRAPAPQRGVAFYTGVESCHDCHEEALRRPGAAPPQPRLPHPRRGLEELQPLLRRLPRHRLPPARRQRGGAERRPPRRPVRVVPRPRQRPRRRQRRGPRGGPPSGATPPRSSARPSATRPSTATTSTTPSTSRASSALATDAPSGAVTTRAPRVRLRRVRLRRRCALMFTVLHEDADVLAVDKPAGVVVIPPRRGARREPAAPVGGRGASASGSCTASTATPPAWCSSRATPRPTARSPSPSERRLAEKTSPSPAASRKRGVIDVALHPARKGKMRPALAGETGAIDAVTDCRVLRAWRRPDGDVARRGEAAHRPAAPGEGSPALRRGPAAGRPPLRPRRARGVAGVTLARLTLHAHALAVPPTRRAGAALLKRPSRPTWSRRRRRARRAAPSRAGARRAPPAPGAPRGRPPRGAPAQAAPRSNRRHQRKLQRVLRRRAPPSPCAAPARRAQREVRGGPRTPPSAANCS